MSPLLHFKRCDWCQIAFHFLAHFFQMYNQKTHSAMLFLTNTQSIKVWQSSSSRKMTVAFLFLYTTTYSTRSINKTQYIVRIL